MKVIYNSILPFPGYIAINLFGMVFVRRKYEGKEPKNMLRHEAIHTAQMRELGFILFYVLYFFEWFFRLCWYMNFDRAYRNLSFEVEAYAHEADLEYLENRKPFAQWRKQAE